jgi:hypothetical protein
LVRYAKVEFVKVDAGTVPSVPLRWSAFRNNAKISVRLAAHVGRTPYAEFSIIALSALVQKVLFQILHQMQDVLEFIRFAACVTLARLEWFALMEDACPFAVLTVTVEWMRNALKDDVTFPAAATVRKEKSASVPSALSVAAVTANAATLKLASRTNAEILATIQTLAEPMPSAKLMSTIECVCVHQA